MTLLAQYKAVATRLLADYTALPMPSAQAREAIAAVGAALADAYTAGLEAAAKERDAAQARIKELEETLRGWLNKAGPRAHRVGCACSGKQHATDVTCGELMRRTRRALHEKDK